MEMCKKYGIKVTGCSKWNGGDTVVTCDLCETVRRYVQYSTDSLSSVMRGQFIWSLCLKYEDKSLENKKGWSGREDLNLRHLTPHASALPGCATPRKTPGFQDLGIEGLRNSEFSNS